MNIQSIMKNCLERKLTEVKWTFSTSNVVVDVGYAQGVGRGLSHADPQQRYEEYGQDVLDYRVLDPLLRQEFTLAVLGGVGSLLVATRIGPSAKF